MNAQRQQQINDSQALSQMLQKTLTNLDCGPECQKQKKLKSAYMTSAAACETAPTARKDYLISKQGATHYEEVETRKLEKEAGVMEAKLRAAFAKQVDNVEALIAAYDTVSQEMNFGQPLVAKLRVENTMLAKDVVEITNDTTVNDRKGFYAQSRTAINDRRYAILRLVYYLLTAVWTVVGILRMVRRKALDVKWVVATVVAWLYPWAASWIGRVLMSLLGGLRFYVVSIVSNVIAV
jgi:hypothetical protein